MKILGRVLVGLGAFLVVAAVVALTWAPGAVKRTPVDVDSVTVLSGEAARLDTATNELGAAEPIYALSITKSDSEASSDDTAVFFNRSCAVYGTEATEECPAFDDESVLSGADDFFATDRTTAESVESDELPAQAAAHEGVVNKWPFDAEKTTYTYFDSVTGEGVDAVYDRTEDVMGLETYVYRVEIQDAPIVVSALLELNGTYDDVKEIYVDPRTGAIIHQTDDQQRYLDDGTQALDLQLAFTEDQQATNVAEAEENIASLDLITRTVPIVGFVGGGLLLVAGAVLLLRARPRTAGTASTTHRDRTPAGR
ncbi:DUF3068 domain-containing protein [Nocardioides sp. Leaf307]|uniref:DUF3068 domain-containing protein n=1 Tax=Nocardioides sp. Leaf307 TaxID=1736331 RepID=UPI0009E935A7|nr:DUF3068 domain-containing protein [Nocardioides sp. Leaf307]